MELVQGKLLKKLFKNLSPDFISEIFNSDISKIIKEI